MITRMNLIPHFLVSIFTDKVFLLNIGTIFVLDAENIELLVKIIVGILTIIFTIFKIYSEIKKIKEPIKEQILRELEAEDVLHRILQQNTFDKIISEKIDKVSSTYTTSEKGIENTQDQIDLAQKQLDKAKDNLDKKQD